MSTPKKRFDELSPFKIVHHDWDRPYPVHVEIDPTSRCNQDCLRCSYKQEIDGARDYIIQDQQETIPLERFLSLVDEFSEMGIRAVTLSGGGEPLVYKNIDRVIQGLFDKQIKLGIITNLALPINVSLLSQAVWIRVSLDAGSEESYQLLHRPGRKDAFALVLNNIKDLTQANPELDLGVNFLIQPENETELVQAAEQVKALGARYIRYTPAIATDAIDYPSLFDRIRDDLETCKSLIDDDFHVFVVGDRFDSLADKKKSYNFCYKQQIHPLIGADGQVYPCCLLKYYEKHALGSILEKSFKEVWDGAQRQSWLKCLDVDQCPSCWFDRTNEFMEYLLTQNPKHVDFV